MDAERARRPVAVLAGGTGFIGRHLSSALAEEGYEVRGIDRRGIDIPWGDPHAIRSVVEGASLLVNLAGRSVNCRYTDANREQILASRLETTRQLREAVAGVRNPPPLWINASTATIYRYALDRPQTERDGEVGTGFSVDVARNWEREFFAGELPGVRRVAIRTSIVIGDGDATALLLTLARLGLGGTQHDGWWFGHRRYRGIGPDPSGNGRAPWHRSRGRQMFSWIHVRDVVRAVQHIRDTPGLAGPVNLSAPTPVPNDELMRSLRRVVRAWAGVPSLRWMIELATAAMRTESELVLKSRWVLPERLLESGFRFEYEQVGQALGAAASSPALSSTG